MRTTRGVLIFFCALLTLLLSDRPSFAQAEQQQPNLLFLYADDLSYHAIRSSGNLEVQTPNLDRLAQQGTTFTHCFNMGGWHGAICVASRTMLQTGRPIWQAHQVENTLGQERAAGRLWSESLRSAGYRTYFTGKWHVKIKPENVFDVTRDVRQGGMPRDTNEAYNRPREGEPDSWSPDDESQGGYWTGGKHWSEVTADNAISFLQEARSQSLPSFIYVGFNAPHDPRQAPKSFLEKYPVDRISIPSSFLPVYPYRDEMGCPPSLRDESLAPFPRTERAVRVHRREYYAIITHLDEQIGRILDALDASGQRDNTWIFFTADNGLAVGHHGLFGKQNMYDHSLRVPLIVAGPGVKPGERIETAVYLQDIMPTTLDLAGKSKPGHVYFESLLPLLNGTSRRDPRPLYGAFSPHLQRMVRHHGYKLILYPQAPVARLYHVDEDTEEQYDLMGIPESLPIARKLFQELLALQKEVGDTLDLIAIYPELASR